MKGLTLRQALRCAPAVLAVAGLIGTARAAEPAKNTFNWLNPTTWPVVPVPNISVDPSNGVTVGLIPTLLEHDRRGRIVRIIAPDIVHNANFGWGGHMRILEFPSAYTQWSVVAGLMQHVESSFDTLYKTGLLRARRWSQSAQLSYNRSGTARFFGIGNESAYADQSVFTDQRLRMQALIGWNLTHAWQLALDLTVQKVRVSAGHLPGIVSITERFPQVLGMGTTHEVRERILVTYDTRDNITIPTRGVDVVLYTGAASRTGAPDGSLFTEAGRTAASIGRRCARSPSPRTSVCATCSRCTMCPSGR
ncbi:MAG: BamA/TamA family outer membrane protein [Steroidobacteraceae bacterium]